MLQKQKRQLRKNNLRLIELLKTGFMPVFFILDAVVLMCIKYRGCVYKEFFRKVINVYIC